MTERDEDLEEAIAHASAWRAGYIRKRRQVTIRGRGLAIAMAIVYFTQQVAGGINDLV